MFCWMLNGYISNLKWGQKYLEYSLSQVKLTVILIFVNDLLKEKVKIIDSKLYFGSLSFFFFNFSSTSN